MYCQNKYLRRIHDLKNLLAPKASEASKGAFYLFLGVDSGYCEQEVTVMGGREVTVRVFNGCAIRGSAEKWQIHTHW